MVKVIMGLRGSGKTKALIDMVNESAAKEAGSVVCLERGTKLTYDVKSSARLVDTKENGVADYAALKAFISGLYAGNYDISKIYIDSLSKIAQCDDLAAAEEFLDWAAGFCQKNNTEIIATLSADINAATEGIKKYF